MIYGFLASLFIRLFLVPNPGFEADVSFWKSWGLAVADFGLVKGLALTNFNYPTPFGYLLFLMTKAYALFADPHNFNQFWQNNNLLFLFIAKLPAILADFGIAGVFLYIGRNAKKLGFPQIPYSIYSTFALVYLLNPVSWIDGAWWGQLDSLGVLLFLLAFLALLQRRAFLAGVVYMIAVMTKLQNMIYGPVFFLLVWQIEGSRGLVQSIAGATLAFAGANGEFILAKKFSRVVESVVGNYDYFPWLSLNAFNPWWIYSGGAGMKSSDKILVAGLVNAKSLGLYLFSGTYLFALIRQWKWPADIRRKFLESFIVVNGAFFLFQTQSHDRYAFPLIVMVLLLVPFYKKYLKNVSIIYILFSVLYFYNLHTALVVNYPDNGIPILSNLTQPWLTVGVSYVFTGAFVWLLLWLSRGNVLPLVISLSLVSLMLFIKNLPLIARSPVYLSTLTPIEYEQDYGERTIDMPINASLGFSKWGSLSVQYAFYRRGIGTHANGYQIFDIGKRFSRFSFDYGVDTEAGPQGTVTFEVWGLPAGRQATWKKLFASQKIGRYDLPRHADVAVSGVQMLKLVVTDAGDGITDDHADWLNAKLYE